MSIIPKLSNKKLSTRAFSSTQEKRIASNLKGKMQPNSGATRFSKGDVKSELFLIECKTMTTERESISIKKEWLTKIKQEAFASNRRFSAVAFNFGGLDNRENFYIIDERTFKRIHSLLEDEESY